jgi:DNA-binding CsgD family transcriptional regulator
VAAEPSSRQLLQIAAETLTDRQLAAVVLLEQGRSYRTIARELNISLASAWALVDRAARRIHSALDADT